MSSVLLTNFENCFIIYPMTDELFTTPQAAEYLGVKPLTLFRYREDGTLPGQRYGNMFLYSRAELDAFKEKYGERKRGRPKKQAS